VPRRTVDIGVVAVTGRWPFSSTSPLIVASTVVLSVRSVAS